MQALTQVYYADGEAVGVDVMCWRASGCVGGETLAANGIFQISGGFPEQAVESIGVELSGTDAQGHVLSFLTYVALITQRVGE